MEEERQARIEREKREVKLKEKVDALAMIDSLLQVKLSSCKNHSYI